MRRYILIVALVMLFSLPLVASVYSLSNATSNTITIKQGDQTTTIEPNTDSILTLPLGYYADKLNPASSTSAYDWDILGLLFDGFMMPNPFNYFDVEADFPWMLAEKPNWTVVDNTTSYWVFKLRDDIKFFDGVPLTADDVVFTYDFIKWLGEYSEAWYDLAKILIRAEKIDNYTVKVWLNTTGYITARYAFIIVFPKHIYEKESTWGVVDDNNNDVFPNWDVTQTQVVEYRAKSPNDPILTGYGMFRLVSWSPADALCTEATLFEFERNPNYFMAAIAPNGTIIEPWHSLTEDYVNEKGVEAFRGPYIKKLRYRVIIEASDIVNALIGGEIDMAADFAFGRYHNELSAANLTMAYAPRLGFGHTLVNCRAWPLNESAFRRAIAYAYDKRAVVQNVWAGYAEPLDVPIPKSMGDWSIESENVPAKYRKPDSYYDSNIPKALAELEKIGISDTDGDGWLEGPDGQEITLVLEGTDTKDVRDIVSVLATSLENLGIHVQKKFVDFRTLLSDRSSGQFDLLFFGYGLGRLPTFLQGFLPDSSPGRYTGWVNETYIDLVQKAFYQESDLNKIKEYVWQLQLIFFYELPDIPIYMNTIVGAYRSAERFGTDGWVGVFESLVGAPVVNSYTLIKAVKPKTYNVGAAAKIPIVKRPVALASDAPIYIAIGVIVDIAIIGAVLFLKRKVE